MKNINPLIKKCDLGDAQIQYLHYPSGGPDLILLHATGFLSWLWHPIASRLAGTFNIIVPDFHSYRTRDPEQGGLSWKLLSDDIYKLSGILGLKNPYITGHSMGGTVAVLCAALHDLNPKKMLLIEPIFLPEITYSIKITVQQHPLASKSINRKNSWKDREEAFSYIKNRKLFNKWNDDMIDLYIKYGFTAGTDGSLALTCSPSNEASLFMGSTAVNPWPLLHEIKCPLLVLEGEESENKTFVDIKRAVSLFKYGEYLEIKKAGHLIPMEQPEAISSLMQKFFRPEK
jgi:lipase